jgi:RNA polymerase sigma factor (sigma-70 family)
MSRVDIGSSSWAVVSGDPSRAEQVGRLGNTPEGAGVLGVLHARTGNRRLRRLGDERLAALAAAGDVAAFEALYDRHHAPLLAFCRHMVGNREDGEDALQQTFLRAHRALLADRVPDAVRPWLFAIARNRCRTLLAARRPAAVPAEDVEVALDGLADDVRRRADLRELVADLARLPEDQRGALVMHELGDLGHAEIATVIGCAPEKVKALVFQARTTLIAERDARATPCDEIRGQLEVARGGALRRGPLRRHLRECRPCDSYRLAVARQRAGLAIILPVAPSAGLKTAVFGASGAGATVAGGGAAAGGAAAGGGAAVVGAGGGAAAAGGAATVSACKVAAVVCTAALTAGGAVEVRQFTNRHHEAPSRNAVAVAAPAAQEPSRWLPGPLRVDEPIRVPAPGPKAERKATRRKEAVREREKAPVAAPPAETPATEAAPAAEPNVSGGTQAPPPAAEEPAAQAPPPAAPTTPGETAEAPPPADTTSPPPAEPEPGTPPTEH